MQKLKQWRKYTEYLSTFLTQNLLLLSWLYKNFLKKRSWPWGRHAAGSNYCRRTTGGGGNLGQRCVFLHSLSPLNLLKSSSTSQPDVPRARSQPWHITVRGSSNLQQTKVLQQIPPWADWLTDWLTGSHITCSRDSRYRLLYYDKHLQHLLSMQTCWYASTGMYIHWRSSISN